MDHIKLLFYILFALLCFSSCSTSKQVLTANLYFDGLEALKSDDTTVAIKAFTQSIQKDSQTASLLAIEELLPLLYETEDYSAILDITDSRLDIKAQATETDGDELQFRYEIDPNLLYRYRLLAMIQTNHPQIIDHISDWITPQVFSREHLLFFESNDFTTFAEQTLNQQNEFFSQTLDLIAFRLASYKRDYGASLRVGQARSNDVARIDEDLDINDDSENVSSAIFENHNESLLSDIGKALLYGSTNLVLYAELLAEAAESYPHKSDEAFMCHFYAARLYDNAGVTYRSMALEQFKAAMNATKTPERYDNALWYYLVTVSKTSSRSAISALQKFAPQWNDPYYFDDFLETIAFNLLSAENWKGFYGLYEVLSPYMSDDSISKYAYISGRLIEEGFLRNEFSVDAGYENDVDATQAAQKAQEALFKTAFSAIDGSLYYRAMAAKKLDLSTKKLLEALLQREKETPATYDEGFEYILGEYINRDYAQKLYPIYIEHSSAVSFDVAMELSTALAQVNNPTAETGFQNNFYPESLRIASRALNQAGNDISKEQMELLYPRFYTDYVTQMAELYGLSEYVLYALIRSESFFDHDVQSWAGAVGLTQLIPSTAGDIARKLKVTDYDLHNAEINIAFGAFYLDELIPRVDNSMLRALFSYNAGITNVRRWVTAHPEISLIPDLFLEIIPFAETREYGRKILSAAIMYGIFYYDKTNNEIVDEIIQ